MIQLFLIKHFFHFLYYQLEFLNYLQFEFGLEDFELKMHFLFEVLKYNFLIESVNLKNYILILLHLVVILVI